MRVRRTLFLLGQSIIEPRGGFSCQLTFSPIYTRPHKSSSTSSTHSLKVCQVVVKSQIPTTEKQEDARCAITDVYQSVFSAYDTSALQGGGGIIDSKVAKLNHDVSRCDGKIVAVQRFFISLSSCSHLLVMVSFGV